MKLADVQTEDARERLRSSNLDDLEQAFKYEITSESLDGTTSTNDERFPFMPTVPQAPTSPPEVATPGNMMSFAPTSQINVPHKENTFDLSPKPQKSFEHNEDDTIETFPGKVEEKQEEEIDVIINKGLQNHAPNVEEVDDSKEDEKIENKEMNLTEKEELDKDAPKIPLNLESNFSYQSVDEESKEELKPILHQKRSVTFSLPKQEEDIFQVDDEERLRSFNYLAHNHERLDALKNDNSFLIGQNTVDESHSPPSPPQETSPFESYTPTPAKKKKSKPVLVICGYELASPKRKTCFGFLLIIGAAIGLIISMTSPPGFPAIVSNVEPSYDPCINETRVRGGIFVEVNNTIKCAVPTISPAPTTSRLPSLNPTNTNSPTAAPIAPNIYDISYASVQRLIVESQVSPLHTLPKECYLPLCSAGVKENQEISLQQKSVYYLLTQDQIFFKWVNSNDLYAHVEKVLQRYILTLMAFSLTSRGWKSNQHWPVENGFVASISECSWYGLTCEDRAAYINMKDFVDHTYLAGSEPGGREVEIIPMVTKIVLRNNTLVGELPQETFKLRHLEELKLHHNKLTGSLPNSIGLLSNMKKMWLHDTENLAGTIPSAIGSMTGLSSIWIGLNKFRGTIPKEIGQLTKLETIGFLANRLNGTIPTEILELKQLKNLYLDINEFRGTLPELGQLRELRDLRIDTNYLYGTFPSSLSELKKLKNFYAYKNNFSGDLPNSLVVGWESLEKLELFSNKLTGTISTFLGQLPNLITVDLHDNEFNSTIPSQICAQNRLKKLDLGRNNKIRGKIPDLSDCVSLETLDVSNNALTGTVPGFLKVSLDLEYLNIQGNNFEGILPKGLCMDIPKCFT